MNYSRNMTPHRNNIKQMLREQLLKEKGEYFEPTIPDQEQKKHTVAYEGRNVIWYGDPEQMIVVHKDDIEEMWGNIYYEDKMEEVVQLVTDHEDMVEFEVPYAHGNVVELVDIEEEQRSEIEGGFEIDYDGKERPASTGSEELDAYIAHENLQESDIAEFEMMSDRELVDFINKNKLSIAKGRTNENALKEKIKELVANIDIGIDEDDEEAIEAFIEYEKWAKEAVENNEGDLGEFRVQLRDGHHRVMGSIKAGEERVAVNLDKDDIKRFKGYYNKL